MAKKKCKNIIIKQGLDDWVMTYGDMMSLLLTFFVLIVSFSSMQETKFEQAVSSLHEAFGVLQNAESVIELETPIVPNHEPQEEEAEFLYEVRAVEKMVMEKGLDKDVEVEVTDEGVLFRLNSEFAFRSGGAELQEEPRGILDKLTSFFKKFPYSIKIEGHTDTVPINSPKFPSNWELSAARAVSVARYFQGMGLPPDRIAATGMGEFHPIADNGTAEGRAKNRRVEIFLRLAKKDLPRNGQLPMVLETPPGEAAGDQAKENEPVRPIINPVTDKLGSLQRQIRP
nr:OmpA family protein [Candidatus Krumholzibacteria bacterium]